MRLKRIQWHKDGNCWSWFKIDSFWFYGMNQRVITWGRSAFVFERKQWRNG